MHSTKVSIIHETLSDVFGFDSFRPMQEDIIQHSLNGEDTFVVMPTGGGKSLCYQIPAIIKSELTIVVSPLIALMNDQVNGLVQLGVAAAALHSQLSIPQRNEIFTSISERQLQILYLAPETLLNQEVLSVICTINISLIAIDEAHCISMWGNEFRPEYASLSRLKSLFPGTPLMALTATAATVTVSIPVLRQMAVKLALGS